MIRLEEIKYSLQNIMHRKMRSSLTIISILIGIMAIFAIVSFGLGIRNYMDVMASEAGTDKLFLQSKGVGAPGTDETFSITKDQFEFVDRINGVQQAVSMYFKAVKVEFNKQIKYTYMISMDPKKIEFMQQSFQIKIYKGRQLKQGDMNKAVVGYNYQFDEKIFKKAAKIADKIEINGVQFDIVGIVSEVGNPQDDSQIYITPEAFEMMFPQSKDKYGFVILQSAPGENPEALADKITEKLRKYKGQDEGKEDFFVQTMTDALATFGVIINILNGVLGIIALISLIVASVNITNTMYTAVLERTKEIGIMKAVGAKNSDVFTIFVLESGILGMLGGILGVVVGYIVATIGGGIAAGAGYSLLKPIFPWYLIMGCIMFATIVGTIAGMLPAIQASRQKPVDSLRYE